MVQNLDNDCDGRTENLRSNGGAAQQMQGGLTPRPRARKVGMRCAQMRSSCLRGACAWIGVRAAGAIGLALCNFPLPMPLPCAGIDYPAIVASGDVRMEDGASDLDQAPTTLQCSIPDDDNHVCAQPATHTCTSCGPMCKVTILESYLCQAHLLRRHCMHTESFARVRLLLQQRFCMMSGWC